jgi:hypothetical protein
VSAPVEILIHEPWEHGDISHRAEQHADTRKKPVAGLCWSSKPAAVSPAALPVPWQTYVDLKHLQRRPRQTDRGRPNRSVFNRAGEKVISAARRISLAYP